jgi:hypothetical protein
LLEYLASQPGLALADGPGGGLSIEVPADPRFAAELLGRLVGGGFRISSFARRIDSLETVYLRLTEPGGAES